MTLLKWTLAFGVLCAGTVSGRSQGFSLKGNLNGMPDSIRVALYNNENPELFGRLGDSITSEYALPDGSFILKGEVKRPTLAALLFQKKHQGSGRMSTYIKVPLMLFTGDYEFSTNIDYDSIRRLHSQALLYASVDGGEPQKQFLEFKNATANAEKEAEIAIGRRFLKYLESQNNPDTMAIYDAIKEEKMAKFDSLRANFIRNHPDYFISAIVGGNELLQLYKYTDSELNDIAARYEAVPDTAIRNLNARKLAYGRKFAKSMKYPDFKVTTVDGDTLALSSLRESGKPLFIDFWASWCRPCRAAIPHVKELNRKYGSEIQIVSVSVDEDKAAWEKALAKEQMPWRQLWLGDKQQSDAVTRLFALNSIPRLILVDGNDEIVCSTNIPEELTDALEKLMGR